MRLRSTTEGTISTSCICRYSYSYLRSYSTRTTQLSHFIAYFGMATLSPAEDTSSGSFVKMVPYHQIRALHDEESITVYQAYNDKIADAAVQAQTLTVPGWSCERMTWIKPSWSWMMYRSGFSYKDRNQSRILAIRMSHADFESVLLQSSLSNSSDGKQPVRVQWDPERSPSTKTKLPYRSIQIGIGRSVAEKWAKEMILSIEDVTEKAKRMYEDVEAGMGEKELGDKYINEAVYEVKSEEVKKVIRLNEQESNET